MFVHLRNHSHYSLLRALPKIGDFVSEAVKMGMPAVALTDYSNMYGVIEFYNSCKKSGVKPIIGVEFDIHYKERKFKIVLLAKNILGYKNLMRITSLVNTANPLNPLLTDDILLEYSEGLIALSGGIWGDISTLITVDQQEALNRLSFYRKIFGSDYYLEVNPQSSIEDAEMLSKTVHLAEQTNTELVATWNPHYLQESDKQAHRILYLVHGDEHSIDEYNHLFLKDSFAFSAEKYPESIFSNIPRAVENTLKIAEMCTVEIPLGQWVFPAIEFKKSYDEDLKTLAYDGLSLRGIEQSTEVIKRLDYELKVISDKGYSPYFLVVYDLLRFARENKILTNIRGSVAGSLVTYLLQITKCNPFVYKLPFERFLNPERPSAPDIDMDYADTRRDDVIDYARSKYGVDNVAQIGTFGTMMARGAVRDVARAMKFPYIVGDRISKMIPPPKQGFPVTISSALKEVPELKDMYDSDRETQAILDMAQKVEGCARHISVHAAGTVISPSPLWDFTPIQKDPKGGKVITQYDMYTIEDAGLLKFDFLGIRNLTILGDAIEIVREKYNLEVDIEEISLEDKKTFEILARGETIGLFQLNGSGMTRFLKELKPTTIFDINAMVALYRPGPLEMIPEYIRRKHNQNLVAYLDKRLEPILDQSFGVIVYQDDVMLIAIHLAGYSWLEADKLRKAMGKKIPAEMQAQKEKLLKGFLEHGLSEKKSQELWSLIEPFAAYGFNKAHAASYGRVAYQTAYMKANFPVAYMTAVLSNESGDVEKIAEIVSECKRMGIDVLPPDVNESEGGFSIIKDKNNKEQIRFGLYTVKNLGVDISDAIIQERTHGGHFVSLENFIRRIHHKNLNKKSLEALTMCGALDAFAERNELLHNTDSILDFHKDVVKTNANQDSLFAIDSFSSFVMKKTNPADQKTKLTWEKELLGLFVSGFPLDPWKEKINARGITVDKIHSEYKDGKEISLAVIIENIKVTVTKKGDKMGLLRLRDYTGTIEVAVFPEAYKRFKSNILNDVPLLVKGKVSTRNNDKTMILDEIKILDQSS
ncbi:MAG: DNA polymerase III subunit alpha [Candidatus Pacebacteria bacterium]|nr:DNA polymerase III subunit alpha [Candidatus Paceibacterota bacterium]